MTTPSSYCPTCQSPPSDHLGKQDSGTTCTLPDEDSTMPLFSEYTAALYLTPELMPRIYPPNLLPQPNKPQVRVATPQNPHKNYPSLFLLHLLDTNTVPNLHLDEIWTPPYGIPRTEYWQQQ